MANPQLEDGFLRIADELVVAICRLPFTAHEMRLLFAIMNMTYRVTKTKTEISVDDLRYATDLKKYQAQTALDSLLARNVVFKQSIGDDRFLLGIQKDWERWEHDLSKNRCMDDLRDELPISGSIRAKALSELNTNKPIRSTLPILGKRTPPDILLAQIHKELAIPFAKGKWCKERSSATQLYKIALELTHEPVTAAHAIRDYLDNIANPDFRSRVRMPITYMLTGFEKWFKSIPTKPRDIVVAERELGKRYKYIAKTKRWEPA